MDLSLKSRNVSLSYSKSVCFTSTFPSTVAIIVTNLISLLLSSDLTYQLLRPNFVTARIGVASVRFDVRKLNESIIDHQSEHNDNVLF